MPTILFSLAILALFCSSHYYFHRSRNALISLISFGSLFIFIIKYMLDSEMELWVGIGLFGVMSLIRFRETFKNDIDIVYLFIAISIALITFLSGENLIVVWSVYFCLFIVLWFLEMFVDKLEYMEYVCDIEVSPTLESLETELWVKIENLTLIEANQYRLLKTYEVAYKKKR